MEITSEKIRVTYSMMQSANMTRGEEIGIPVDPQNPSKGVRWKKMMSGELTDDDFDAIEEYFILKQNTK